MSRPPFADRSEAGRALAAALATYVLAPPVVVLALPRGGVPVAAEVARALAAPLDLLLVRKIGAPWQPELAVAAVVEGTPPEVVVDETIRADTGVQPDWIAHRAEEEIREIARRRRTYLGDRPPTSVAGATVVVVDDGIATGTTMRAALRALRRRGPRHVVLAVPVAPAEVVAALRESVDALVCLEQPEDFRAVGCHFVDFHQVPDEEVVALLAAAERAAPCAVRPVGPAGPGRTPRR